MIAKAVTILFSGDSMAENTEMQKNHGILLRGRSHLEITAVTDVISFDEDSVNLETPMGEMLVEGEEMRVGTLDTQRGILTIDGRINGLYYRTEEPRKKGIGRLFSK